MTNLIRSCTRVDEDAGRISKALISACHSGIMAITRPRPQTFVRLAVTGAAYFLASGLAIALTRFEGGAAFLWIANAILLASLTTVGRRHWFALILCCWATGSIATGIFGLGWTAAPFISFPLVTEPFIAAVLIRHWGVHRSFLDSARNFSVFVLAAGIIAPACTGLAGAAVISLVSHTSFSANYSNWLVGHALSALTFTPIFLQLASGDIDRWVKDASFKGRSEAALLFAILTVTSAGVFSQSQLPLLFLPILPLMLITFRTGNIGAAFAIVIIATVGTGLTLKGLGPINLIHGTNGHRLQFLQFYLTTTVMTVLPVAAELARRHLLFERLQDSEARFRLLTENSTDIVLNLGIDGAIRYASPSIKQLGGYDPHQLIGTASINLVDVEDRGRVAAAHLQALISPSEMFSVEFRAIVTGGQQRWFEMQTRAVTDHEGVIRGLVSAVRDISTRHLAEVELSKAANTDPLTGLSNRRAFDHELTRQLGPGSGANGGCVAIFDLDHFKRINDTFGHAIGDNVLCAFARVAEGQICGGDSVARIGGEEFGFIFPKIPGEHAYAVCERIREAVAAIAVKAGDWPVRVTVSIGIAQFREGDDRISALSRADEALYAAKKQGRNQSSLAA